MYLYAKQLLFPSRLRAEILLFPKVAKVRHMAKVRHITGISGYISLFFDLYNTILPKIQALFKKCRYLQFFGHPTVHPHYNHAWSHPPLPVPFTLDPPPYIANLDPCTPEAYRRRRRRLRGRRRRLSPTHAPRPPPSAPFPSLARLQRGHWPPASARAWLNKLYNAQSAVPVFMNPGERASNLCGSTANGRCCRGSPFRWIRRPRRHVLGTRPRWRLHAALSWPVRATSRAWAGPGSRLNWAPPDRRCRQTRRACLQRKRPCRKIPKTSRPVRFGSRHVTVQLSRLEIVPNMQMIRVETPRVRNKLLTPSLAPFCLLNFVGWGTDVVVHDNTGVFFKLYNFQIE